VGGGGVKGWLGGRIRGSGSIASLSRSRGRRCRGGRDAAVKGREKKSTTVFPNAVGPRWKKKRTALSNRDLPLGALRERKNFFQRRRQRR